MNTIINIIYIIVIFNVIITIIKSTDTCNFKTSGKDFTIEFKGYVKNNFKILLNGIFNYIYYYGDTYCVGQWTMISKNDGDVYKLFYYGDIKNGMPHSISENTMITYSYNLDNDVHINYYYNGIWKDGYKEGFGRQQITFMDKNNNNVKMILIQKGIFSKNDIIEGYEFSYSVNNSCSEYNGKFHENRPHGYGIIHFNNGSIFEGEFDHGKIFNIDKNITDKKQQFTCLEKLTQPF
jgi:hypothetical protein